MDEAQYNKNSMNAPFIQHSPTVGGIVMLHWMMEPRDDLTASNT